MVENGRGCLGIIIASLIIDLALVLLVLKFIGRI